MRMPGNFAAMSLARAPVVAPLARAALGVFDAVASEIDDRKTNGVRRKEVMPLLPAVGVPLACDVRDMPDGAAFGVDCVVRPLAPATRLASRSAARWTWDTQAATARETPCAFGIGHQRTLFASRRRM